MFAYNNTLPDNIKTGVNSTGWMALSEPLITGGGKYCQLKVAADDSIHIAAYDSVNGGQLKYVYIADYKQPGQALKCTVDSYMDFGEHLTIDVARESAGCRLGLGHDRSMRLFRNHRSCRIDFLSAGRVGEIEAAVAAVPVLDHSR